MRATPPSHVCSALDRPASTSHTLAGAQVKDYDTALENLHVERLREGAGGWSALGAMSWPQQVGVLQCALANAVDAIEVMSLSYVLPRLERAYPEWLPPALSGAVFGGMLAGGVVGGLAADGCGRRPVFVFSMVSESGVKRPALCRCSRMSSRDHSHNAGAQRMHDACICGRDQPRYNGRRARADRPR